ncbi:MAG TPA: hypothetical protein VLL08_23025 [Kineosporiaceae bacterium]|nr:hypothetical protein [Kineosporiaceae bacterium]
MSAKPDDTAERIEAALAFYRQGAPAEATKTTDTAGFLAVLALAVIEGHTRDADDATFVAITRAVLAERHAAWKAAGSH